MTRAVPNGLGGWWWMLRHFGLRRTLRYWQEGQRRGWMSRDEAAAFLKRLT